MRRSQVSFLLTIAAALLLLLGMATGWLLAGWTAHEQPNTPSWRFGLALLAVFVAATLFWLHRFVQIYFFRVKALIDESQLILESNPNRRLAPTGPADIHALMTLLNQYADRFQMLLNERDAQVEQARAELEAERNRLATLMADLSDGVVVCNRDGRILLYNVQARYLLAPTNSPTHTDSPDRDSRKQNRAKSTPGGYIGLGRSIFGLLDRNALTYGLNHLRSRQTSAPGATRTTTVEPVTPTPSSEVTFITTASGGGLLRTQMRALTTIDGYFNGFVLTLHDMTERLASSSRRDQLLQRLTERMRGGLGNVRAAIEMLTQFSTMAEEQRSRFHRVIEEEVTALGGELDETMRTFAADLRAQWHVETIAGTDLLWALKQYLAELPDGQMIVDFAAEQDSSQLWLRVDSYSVVHGLATALALLHKHLQPQQVTLYLHPLASTTPTSAISSKAKGKPQFATLDARWSGTTHDSEAWVAWKAAVTTADAADAVLTLREVADRHGSEVWFQHDPAQEQSYFRLLLPLVQGPPPTILPMDTQGSRAPRNSSFRETTIASRPHYYDFDLFDQPNLSQTRTDHLLDRLTYTVFDTETTGLDPTRDEIISIGALRIVNGRLLRQEVFDQLVDPQRAIPHTATAIHGIDTAMVQGQPPIESVLPQFARFAEETVLLGHNLAFDLRMFAEKEKSTGLHFAQPALDTLVLSEVLHPDEQDHTLEAIAERLGVNVLGRHTALGDALVTGEVFLRMLPLLAAKGIRTLDDALTASKETSMARLRY